MHFLQKPRIVNCVSENHKPSYHLDVSYAFSSSTDVPVRRVERTNLGQVKRAQETEENMDGGNLTRYRG